MKGVLNFIKKQWFLLVMLSVITLIIVVYEML